MKKLFILAAAIALSLTFVPITSHASVTRESGIISLLNELGIMQGDGNGDMGLDRLVSRAEFAKIAIAASPQKNTVAIGLKMSPYKDVPYTEWYAPYVRAAVSAGYVKGYLDATYRPDNTVTYEEAVTVLLRVLGYDDSAFGAAYPYGQIAQAQGLDMLDDVNGEIGVQMSRRQVMHLIYNTLLANTTSSSASTGIGGAQMAAASGQLLSSHDCAEIENTDVIAGESQDTSLGADKIFTSAGTYTKGDYFSDDCIGMTGTAFIRNSRNIVAFVPDADSEREDYEAYFVYSTLPGSVVGYKDGAFETINIPDSATVYHNQSPTSYAAVKNGLSMGDTLYVKRTSGGSVDYITYESGTMEGPDKVTSPNWLTSIGASTSTTVMRDGVKSSIGAVMTNDIVYYSAPLDIAFAYSNKVTGVYENASPTKDSPSSVTISGVTYAVEGVDAFNNLSSSGSFNYGDTVTICIGKDGGAAGVVTSATQAVGAYGSSSTSGASARIVGYMTGAGKKLFTDSNNREYSSYYVTLVTPEGTAGTYETSSDRSNYVGTVCAVTLKDGKATLGRVSSSSFVSGKVSYDNLTLGDYTLSPNASILDVANDNAFKKVLYKRVYTQRIDGLTLKSSQVLYCERNAMNEITSMILNNVTGDVYTYGAVLSSKPSYTVDVNGKSYPAALIGSYGGPVKLIMDTGGIAGMSQLTRHNNTVSELTPSTAKIGGVTYRLSPDVVCYSKTISTQYRKISIDDAISGDYRIYAYYDKPESTGGRIRVLVCNAD